MPETTKKKTRTVKKTASKPVKIDITNQESEYIPKYTPKTHETFNSIIDERIYSGEDMGLDEIEQARRRFFEE